VRGDDSRCSEDKDDAVPPFPRPQFEYEYDAQAQVAALRQYEATHPGRDIPSKTANRLLLATWNVANLGHPEQQRREKDFQLIAELVGWFDLVALQEVNDSLVGLRGAQRYLPASYQVLFSDRAGNQERLAFLYDSNKVRLLEKVGEGSRRGSADRDRRHLAYRRDGTALASAFR
jgi:hypothetical protein